MKDVIVSVLGHMFIATSLGNITTQDSSLSLFISQKTNTRLYYCALSGSKCVNTFYLIGLMLRNLIKPRERVHNEKQMLRKPHMQTE